MAEFMNPSPNSFLADPHEDPEYDRFSSAMHVEDGQLMMVFTKCLEEKYTDNPWPIIWEGYAYIGLDDETQAVLCFKAALRKRIRHTRKVTQYYNEQLASSTYSSSEKLYMIRDCAIQRRYLRSASEEAKRCIRICNGNSDKLQQSLC